MVARTPAPLIGRAHEMQVLEGVLEAAISGRAQVVLLVGEPGIGKTRLADELATSAAARGAIVAWGRAWEAGGAPDFWPWTEALRALCDALDDAELRRAGDIRWPVVAQIVPQLRRRWPELPVAPTLDPDAARFRLFEGVAGLLAGLCRDQLAVVVLDDLHAADLGSLALLHFVARSVRSGRLVIIGTHRDAEARRSPDHGDALARVARDGHWLALSRLDRDAVAGWVSATGGQDDEADALWATTEGNPLFVLETLRLMRAGPRTRRSTRGISESVHAVIRARLDVLPRPTLALLEAAAVLGRRFDVARAAAISDVPLLSARDQVDEAVDADVLSDLGGDRAEFSHILLREVLYAALPARARAELHAAAARILMPLEADVGEASLAELVHHVFKAVPVVSASEAIGWARSAASRAIRALAYDEAVDHLERALALAAPLEAGGDLQRCDLLLALVEAQVGAGRTTLARQSGREAAAIARRLRDPIRLAHAALGCGRVFAFAVVDAELIELLNASLQALPESDDPLRARLLARLAAALQPARIPQEPMSLASEAIAMAQRLEDPATRLEVLVAGGSALAYFADPRVREPVDRQVVDLARAAGDQTRALRGLLRLTFDHLEQGDVASADACIAEYDRHSTRLGLPALRWLAPMLRAMRDVMSGRFAEAEAGAEEAEAIAARIDDANAATSIALHRLGLLFAATRNEDFAAASPPVIDRVMRLADPWYGRSFAACMHARAGRLAEAHGALAALAADFEPMRGRVSLAWVAEASTRLEAPSAPPPAVVLDQLAELSGRNHCWGVLAMVCEGPITHALGRLAARAGRLDDAIGWLRDARARCEAIAAPPLRAAVELDLVEALVGRGSKSDRECARPLLDAAAETSGRLPLPGLAPRLRHLGAQLASESAGRPRDVPPPDTAEIPSDPQTMRFSMRREGEVWAIRGTNEFRLKDSRGLRILARLVDAPGQEHHVTDLLAPRGEAGYVADAGDALDEKAIAEYRARLQDLREQEKEADAWADPARAERASAEIEALARELSRNVGLGGRARKASATSEKARINVRQRLRDALERISEHDPPLGRHLRRAVRTGVFCSYDPSGR